MRHLRSVLTIISVLWVLATPSAVAAAPEISAEQLSHLERVIEDAIRAGACPGAVVVVGHQGQVVYRRGIGKRSHVPEQRPMTETTIFDIASLTKVVATAPAIMQLVEQ